MEFSESINDDEMKARAISMDAYISAEIGFRARDRSIPCRHESSWAKPASACTHSGLSRHGAAMMAILDGDFRGAENFAKEGLKLGRLISATRIEGVYGIQMFSIRREQGRLAEVAPVVKRQMTRIPARKLGCPALR